MDKKYTDRKTPRQAVRYEDPEADLSQNSNYSCPIELTLDVIGGKWKSVILWRLKENNRPLRFAELKKLIDGLTPRMLARQLRELEDHGIVYRDVFPVVPPRVEYGLTSRGKTLGPALDSLCKWGKSMGWKKLKKA